MPAGDQFSNRFARQMEHFSECILTGTPVKRPPIDGLRNMAALAALKRSVETGRAVTLSRSTTDDI